MVDLKKLIGQRRVVDVTDPIKLFESLDRQASHTTLRPAQTQALEGLAARRNERDLVLKMSTGAGKTATALLFMWSHTQEKNKPGVFLCATNQLVEQVITEAERLGIKATSYQSRQAHPDPTGMSGRSLIICSYEKLFNARTTFDRDDVGLTPCIIAMDDAHAGIDRIRDAFTIHFQAKDKQKIRQKIIALFEDTLRRITPGPWSGIENADPLAMVEIPYWVWRPLAGKVREILAKADADEHESLVFVWKFLRDHLEWCRCIISGTGLEIIPDVLPIGTVRAFKDANHRLFMSATLADDSTLVRELNCDPKAVLSPIIPKADSGIGERMVLAPSLFHRDLGRRWVQDWCRQLAKRYRVVVLCPSERAAIDWKAFGAITVTGDDVSSVVKGLRTGTSPFVAFAQRYDGIDLPDNACRVLVIDGMPYGQGIAAAYDTDPGGAPGGSQIRLIHRIEQGMGRAVRSQADYAVVILAGPELASYIAKNEVLDRMNAGTRAQLMLTQELAEAEAPENQHTAAETMYDLLAKCLQRDDTWKDLYEDRVRRAAAAANHEVDKKAVEIASAERRAFQEAIAGRTARASDIIQEAVNNHSMEPRQEGWLLQRAASYQWEVDQAKAIEMQNAAHQRNSRLFVAPKGTAVRPRDPEKSEPQVIVDRWYKSFSNQNGAVAAVEEFRARLSFGNSYRDFEHALKEVAELVGASAIRPEEEYQEGPDCIWFWHDVAFVIEAKNEAKYARVPKKDTAQLHDSVQWFKNNYKARNCDIVPLLFAPVSFTEKQANFPDGTRVMTPQKTGDLVDALAVFVAALASKLPSQWTLAEIGQLQLQHKLSAKQIATNFTLPLLKAT